MTRTVEKPWDHIGIGTMPMSLGDVVAALNYHRRFHRRDGEEVIINEIKIADPYMQTMLDALNAQCWKQE